MVEKAAGVEHSNPNPESVPNGVPSGTDESTHANGPSHERRSSKPIEERLRFQAQLLGAAGEAMIAVDGEDRVLYWNRAAEDLYGWSAEEAMGRNLTEMVVSEELEDRAAEIMAEVRSGRSWSGEFEVRRRDGTAFPVEATNTPVFGEDGELVGVVGMLRDVTERKEAEEEKARQALHSALRADVSAALAEGGTLPSILQRCAGCMVRHLDAAFARIWTVNEEESVLELEASAGLYTHLDGAHSRVPVGEYKIGLIARERKAHLTNDVLEDPRISARGWAELLSEMGCDMAQGYLFAKPMPPGEASDFLAQERHNMQ